jgi:polyhydroxyalkanoate synthesis regulator phasin
MPSLLDIYHIVGIFVAALGVFGYLVKLYVGNVGNNLKTRWTEQINGARKSIIDKYDKENSDIKNLVEKECSTDAIKNKVKDLIESQVKFMEHDLRQIKEITYDLKGILATQQETLIAIQMSVTELKPKIDNLEARVQKLETKNS